LDGKGGPLSQTRPWGQSNPTLSYRGLGTLRVASGEAALGVGMFFCVLNGMATALYLQPDVADLPRTRMAIVTDCLPNQNKGLNSVLTFP
jgi:hypothetical protein